LALVLAAPRVSFIIASPCSPISGRPSHAGMCRGGASIVEARNGSHSATGAGSSSTML